ncbi:MAG: VCBS repeat-containing protein, partial [Verrucomicrobia bacterium]|nr:VCBS repeat-containing protein [Verrucomicrobiota bacterium]
MDLKRQKSKISISLFLLDVLCHLRRMKSGSFLAQDVGLVCLGLLISGCGDNLEKIEPVNVSLTPQKAPEEIDFESQREILESASLAGEMMSESYGQWMEAIWDDVKSSKDKLGVFRKLEFISMQWGQWSDQRRIDHDIGLHDLQPSSKRWTPDEWRSWLEEIKSAGIELAQMQWRHVGFMAHDDRYSSPVSKFTFEFHAKRGEPATRWILRGGMNIIWYSSRKSNVFGGVKHIEVTEATLLQRDGLPPFEHVVAADVSPADQDLVLEPNLQVLDLDGDFAPEIILSRINRVFWNQGSGRFRTGSLLEFPLAQFHQGIVADFSGNAFLDFLAVTTEGLALYEGDGKGAFAKAPRRQDLFNGQLINPFVLTSGDIDGDSDLDVWLGQYKVPYQDGQMPAPFFDANDGHPAFLLINEGNGTFSDATIEAGLESKRFRRTYSASLVDLDHDLDLDLAVVSDFSGVDFYRNDGSGHFEDVTRDWGGNRYGFGMAHLLGDWNLDQRLDLL